MNRRKFFKIVGMAIAGGVIRGAAPVVEEVGQLFPYRLTPEKVLTDQGQISYAEFMKQVAILREREVTGVHYTMILHPDTYAQLKSGEWMGYDVEVARPA